MPSQQEPKQQDPKQQKQKPQKPQKINLDDLKSTVATLVKQNSQQQKQNAQFKAQLDATRLELLRISSACEELQAKVQQLEKQPEEENARLKSQPQTSNKAPNHQAALGNYITLNHHYAMFNKARENSTDPEEVAKGKRINDKTFEIHNRLAEARNRAKKLGGNAVPDFGADEVREVFANECEGIFDDFVVKYAKIYTNEMSRNKFAEYFAKNAPDYVVGVKGNEAQDREHALLVLRGCE